MKNLIINLVLITTVTFSTIQSSFANQSIVQDDSSKYEEVIQGDKGQLLRSAASTIAFLAHPTSEVVRTSISTGSTSGDVNVTYKSAWTGELFTASFKVRFNRYGLVTSVSTNHDEAFVPAFVATTGFKEVFEDILYDIDQEDFDEAKSFVEAYVGKRMDEFNGEDLCVFLVNCIAISEQF